MLLNKGYAIHFLTIPKNLILPYHINKNGYPPISTFELKESKNTLPISKLLNSDFIAVTGIPLDIALFVRGIIEERNKLHLYITGEAYVSRELIQKLIKVTHWIELEVIPFTHKLQNKLNPDPSRKAAIHAMNEAIVNLRKNFEYIIC